MPRNLFVARNAALRRLSSSPNGSFRSRLFGTRREISWLATRGLSNCLSVDLLVYCLFSGSFFDSCVGIFFIGGVLLGFFTHLGAFLWLSEHCGDGLQFGNDLNVRGKEGGGRIVL
ncbi:hypothetical protein BDZ91DRAFT_70930 [Kalaharituber pfeilii]|nr:hypothetical protein BDZ91DRAFT_70930 [Kalaharituber pfeilii]